MTNLDKLAEIFRYVAPDTKVKVALTFDDAAQSVPVKHCILIVSRHDEP